MLGTLVSQTLLNVAALVVLGIVMVSTIGLFAGRQQALLWYALAPIMLMLLVLAAPALVHSGLPSRHDSPSLTRAGAPSTNAVAISTACRMIP